MKENLILFCGILLVFFLSGCETPPAPVSNSSAPTSSSSAPPSGPSKESPQITSAGTGCADNYCIWIAGTNFAPNSLVEVRKSGDSGPALAKYSDEQLTRAVEGSKHTITFAITEQNIKDLMNNPGVIVRVVNPDGNLYSDSEPVIREGKK